MLNIEVIDAIGPDRNEGGKPDFVQLACPDQMRRPPIENAPCPAGLPVSVNAWQKADRFVFAPLCWVLTLLRPGLPEADPSKAPQPGSLLFVKLAEQG